MSSKGLILAAALLAGTSLGAVAGTVAQLRNNLPFIDQSRLLRVPANFTDGSILFQGGLLQDFYRFKPDIKGRLRERLVHCSCRGSAVGTIYPLTPLQADVSCRTGACS